MLRQDPRSAIRDNRHTVVGAHLGAMGFTGNARRARVRSYDEGG
ncbi:hypothetical protein [Xanthomonas arboricola]